MKESKVFSKDVALAKLRSDREIYYRYPELNHILYLSGGGWTSMDGLELFTNLKVLYIEDNCLIEVPWVSHCKHLRALYVLAMSNRLHCRFASKNRFHDVASVLSCVELRSLDLSDNYVSYLQGIGNLVELETLKVSGNHLCDDTLGSLLVLNKLRNLDLSCNRITSIDSLNGFDKLRLLKVAGNPICETPQYRKRLIFTLPDLQYLDDSPVTENERRLACTYMTGGALAEEIEREVINDEERCKREADFEAYEVMRQEVRRSGIAPNILHNELRERQAVFYSCGRDSLWPNEDTRSSNSSSWHSVDEG
jgi:dynein assembly factor 1